MLIPMGLGLLYCRYLYQSFDDEDYQEFLGGGGARGAPAGFALGGCGPNVAGSVCGNFNKPRMALGGAKHRELPTSLVSLWQHSRDTGDGEKEGRGGSPKSVCEYLVEATLPAEAHTLGGAPAAVWTRVRLAAQPAGTGSLELELEYLAFNKTATRLPESIFVQFKPAVAAEPAPLGWSLEMFNDSSIALDPMDVMPTPNGSGGAPHTRCVSGVRWQADGGEDAPSMWLSSKDVPCVCTGTPTPFPTPRNEPPNMADGVSYNIYNNIWNTK
jgi:hypothetical protein